MWSARVVAAASEVEDAKTGRMASDRQSGQDELTTQDLQFKEFKCEGRRKSGEKPMPTTVGRPSSGVLDQSVPATIPQIQNEIAKEPNMRVLHINYTPSALHADGTHSTAAFSRLQHPSDIVTLILDANVRYPTAAA